MRCALPCPAPSGAICRGESNSVFCRHVNPNDPLYAPAYIRILVADDVVIEPVNTAQSRLDAAYAQHGTAPLKGGCCGG